MRRLKSISPYDPEFIEVERRIDNGESLDGSQKTVKIVWHGFRAAHTELLRQEIINQKLLWMIFGHKTEKLKRGSENSNQETSGNTANSRNNTEPSTPGQESNVSEDSAPTAKGKRKGHGRRSSDSLRSAERVRVKNELRDGDCCPNCKRGRVYGAKTGRSTFFVGEAPIKATVVELERKRCNACQKSFVAPLPEKFRGQSTYDPSVAAVVATMHYGMGATLYAFERLQEQVGTPVAAGTMYDLLKEQAVALEPVGKELRRVAAQADVIHVDDTTMKILNRAKLPTENEVQQQVTQASQTEGNDAENKQCDNSKVRTARASAKKSKKKKTTVRNNTKREARVAKAKAKTKSAPRKKALKQRSIKTTGLVARIDGHTIALFETGDAHAGNVFAQILKARSPDLPLPVQMCDALAENVHTDTAVHLAYCMAHARRMFYEIKNSSPKECDEILAVFGQVYATDKKACKLTPEERLVLHQQESLKPMDAMKAMMQTSIDNKLVEPNAVLGKAYRYVIRHWNELTLFLRHPGVPLDNNVCERALKMAIKHRKNSLFYKTSNGAAVGDLHMSILHTCQLNGVDSIAYMTAVSRYMRHVNNDISMWMPWNYRDAIDRLTELAKAAA